MFGPGSSRPWLRWLLLFSLLFNGLFVGAYAFGEYRSRRCASGCGPSCELSRRLGFDARQVEAMRESYARMQAAMAPLKGEIAVQREEIAGILAAPSPDREALFRKVDGLAALQARMQKLILTHLLEQERVLTAPQREEYRRLLKERLCPVPLCGGSLVEGTPERRCDAGAPR